MLYLIVCTVERKEYMRMGSDEYIKNHIVEATSEENACNAIYQHYENESDYNGGTTYSVSIDDLSHAQFTFEEIANIMQIEHIHLVMSMM